jgi:hypothetical protein
MRYIWLLLTALALHLPPAAGAQATDLQPPAGIVWQLAGERPGAIFAGTWCGVYELAGQSPRWREVPGLRDVPARRLVRLEGDVLLGSTMGYWPGGIWRRAPGESWQRVFDHVDGTFGVAPDGVTVYLAHAGPFGSTTVLRSADNGATWSPLATPNRAGVPGSLAVARNPDTGHDVLLLALHPTRGPADLLLRSLDGGRSWEDVPGYTGDVAASTGVQLFVDPNQTTYYIASVAFSPMQQPQASRLYRAQSNGSALEPLALPAELRDGGITDLLVSGETLFVAGSGGLFTSSPVGAAGSYVRRDEGLAGSTIYDLQLTSASNPRPAATLYAATSTGVYQLSGPRQVWEYTAPGMPICNAPGRTVFEPIPPFPQQPDRRFFVETQHSLSYGFKAFWERNGGLPVFGYPLSEEYEERNVDLLRAFTTQYFERERFEYHPENRGTPYTVLLGRLGDELLASSGRDWRLEDGLDNPFGGGECRRFDVGADQRAVCGPFLRYWQSQGLDLGRPGIAYEESLALFGLPLTVPREEVDPDGDLVLTQWFERARFEYHPDKPEPYKVLLGRLGSEILRRNGAR